MSHLEQDWQHERFRQLFTALGEHYRVVRYDRVGVGLSDRERTRFDMQTEVADLRSLADHLNLDRFSILGVSCGVPPSVAFAGAQPERVERLILYAGFLRGTDIGTAEIRCAVLDLVRASWGMGSRAVGDLFAPELSAQERAEWSERQRRSASKETAARLLELTFALDCSDVAPRLKTPTLVLHRRRDPTIPFECGRKLAAAIPGAKLIALEGMPHVPWEGDRDAIVRAILEFSGTVPDASRSIGSPDARGTDRPDAVLVREGDIWMASFKGRNAHLRHTKGLDDLALLFSNPGRSIHVTDLLAGVVGASSDDASPQALLDDAALDAIRQRARDIESDLAEAEAASDLGRLEGLRHEREALLDEVRSSVGLAGKSRNMNSAVERARKAVTARLRDTVTKMRVVHPELANTQ